MDLYVNVGILYSIEIVFCDIFFFRFLEVDIDIDFIEV